ncbi:MULTISPECIES: helix-turn-helix domain-containing protein [Pseudomonas]|uniref:Cro/Cl family transcriptional regulator n=1 Tax=Pseudomonas nitroreducens TaxID=46680 RepID=A0A246FBC8_PSENT|nr:MULTISPECIES: helix-turn-helix transcriptional regulator [Pseudomonas]MCG8906131.1 helix-turn-helix transcriptional regulator [Pseudomonas sp. DP-17]MDU4250591.1 helix-turn-helix transcriptional regulator [Pseudomonas sp.]OWP51609.1 Cro/Cl family transcriptional regulator [Pseudomonas nitroreducens]
MNVQVIMRDGEAEYAVVPWAEYQALLAAAGRGVAQVVKPVSAPALDEKPDWKTLREARGLSLETLARSVGISPSYLELIENGEREASDAIQHGLRRALGTGESAS